MQDLSWGAEAWLHENAQPGDLLLSGDGGRVGGVIQAITGSRFSHAAVVRSNGILMEAYDHALTPDESDGGVYLISFDEYITRGNELEVLLLQRPTGLDRERFGQATQRYLDHSPTFASTGLAVLGVLLAARDQKMEAAVRARLDQTDELANRHMVETLLAGDGVKRVQCAELATRIYVESGLVLQFDGLSLGATAASLATSLVINPDGSRKLRYSVFTTSSSKRERPADRSTWSIRSVVRSLGAPFTRFFEKERPDVADLIVPGDLTRVRNFEQVGMLERINDSGRWRHVQ